MTTSSRVPGVPSVAALGILPHTPASWSRHLGRLVAAEIRVAAEHGLLTPADGDQLLARLMTVIDQSVDPSRP